MQAMPCAWRREQRRGTQKSPLFAGSAKWPAIDRNIKASSCARGAGWPRGRRSPARDALLHRAGATAGDEALEFEPVARRDGKKVRGAPKHVVFELGDLAVGVDQLPHHLDDALA